MKAKSFLMIPVIAMGLGLMVGCGAKEPATYTISFVDNHVEETPVTLKTLSLKEGTVIAAADLPTVPSYTKAYYYYNFDYFYKLVGAVGEEEEVKLEPGITTATENVTYYAAFKKGDMVSFNATVNLPSGKQTVNFTPANWNTKRDEIIALLPNETDLFDPLVPKVAPTSDVEFNVISSDAEHSPYFDYDFSTLTALPERMRMYNDGQNAPTLKWDNDNKKMVFFDQGAANLYIASYVKNFEMEFTIKGSIDRFAINFGSLGNDGLQQSFNNGVNCNAGFVFVPGHASAISRPWEAKTEKGDYYVNPTKLSNFVKKALTEEGGVKFRIQSYNGAFKLFMNDQYVQTYIFKDANYSGGFISISRGDGAPTYEFTNRFKLQPFNGSQDFYDSVFVQDGQGAKHINDLTPNYRTGFKTTMAIETAEGADQNCIKFVAGNDAGMENYYTAFEYEEFVAEYTIKAKNAADGTKVGFFVLPTNGLDKNQGETQACPAGGFRATVVPSGAANCVRYRTSELANDQYIAAAGGCSTVKDNYVTIKVQMEKTANGHKATFWMANDGSQLSQIGETAELKGYSGGHVGFTFSGTGYIKDFSIKGIN